MAKTARPQVQKLYIRNLTGSMDHTRSLARCITLRWECKSSRICVPICSGKKNSQMPMNM